MTNDLRMGFAIVIASCLTLSSCATKSSSPRYDQAQAEAEIQAIESSWAHVAVTGDPSVINDIFADDFLGVAPDGVQYTKQGFIDDTRAHPLGFTSIGLDSMKVRFFGNIAVAQGSETFTGSDGAPGRFVWTDVLERRDGKWKIVAAEDVMAPVAGDAAGAPLFAGTGAGDAAGKSDIDRTRNAYVAAWNAADAGAIAALYTNDAHMMYPNQPAVAGKDAILAYFKAFFAEFEQKEFALSSQEIRVVGSWAFDRGMYRCRMAPRAGGATIEDSGKYLVVLERQPDGNWKVARDMDNSDRAGAQSARDTQ